MTDEERAAVANMADLCTANALAWIKIAAHKSEYIVPPEAVEDLDLALAWHNRAAMIRDTLDAGGERG